MKSFIPMAAQLHRRVASIVVAGVGTILIPTLPCAAQPPDDIAAQATPFQQQWAVQIERLSRALKAPVVSYVPSPAVRIQVLTGDGPELLRKFEAAYRARSSWCGGTLCIFPDYIPPEMRAPQTEKLVAPDDAAGTDSRRFITTFSEEQLPRLFKGEQVKVTELTAEQLNLLESMKAHNAEGAKSSQVAGPIRAVSLKFTWMNLGPYWRGQSMGQPGRLRSILDPSHYFDPRWPEVLAFTGALLPPGRVELVGTQTMPLAHLAGLVRRQVAGVRLETGRFDEEAAGFQGFFARQRIVVTGGNWNLQDLMACEQIATGTTLIRAGDVVAWWPTQYTSAAIVTKNLRVTEKEWRTFEPLIVQLLRHRDGKPGDPPAQALAEGELVGYKALTAEQLRMVKVPEEGAFESRAALEELEFSYAPNVALLAFAGSKALHLPIVHGAGGENLSWRVARTQLARERQRSVEESN